MVFGRLFRKVKYADIAKYSVLFRAGTRHGVFDKEDQQRMNKLIRKDNFIKFGGFIVATAAAYYIPVPDDKYVGWTLRFFTWIMTNRILTLQHQLNTFDEIQKTCQKYENEKKFDNINLSEREEKLFKKISLREEQEAKYEKDQKVENDNKK